MLTAGLGCFDMRKYIFSSLVMLSVASFAYSQTEYSTYDNDRFHFSIEYPSDLLKMQAAPANNDGRTIRSKDRMVEMWAWGQFNALDLSLTDAYKQAVSNRRGVTYKMLGDRSFVISGESTDKIFYRKTQMRGSGDTAVFYTFTMEYPKSQKEKFDPIITRILRSFKFDPNAEP